ncbi:MAG: hypothetical protein Kow006_08490 [Gammaproteobacteria bacterium]
MDQRILLPALALLLVLLGGCNLTTLRHSAERADARVVHHTTLDEALAEVDRMPLQVIAGGFKGSLAEAMEALADAQVFFVGESHTHYEDHLIQLAILRAAHQRYRDIALGVEWFQQDVQKHLDAYIAGRIDEGEMLRRTEYYERWRFDYRLYRPIMEYAKSNRIPVIALNAPVWLTRRIGRDGLKSLSREERALLPATMERDDPVYVKRIREAYEAHGETDQPFENFLSVQLTWDETMAKNAADYLRRHPERRLLVFAGTGHIGFRSAIPDRFLRRYAVPSVTITTQNRLPEKAPERGDSDVVIVGPPLNLEPTGKLGVLVQTENEKVMISRVLKESGAHRSGIRKGDQIVRVDGQPILSFADLKLALLHQRPGDSVNVAVKRDDEAAREYQVTLQ